MSGGGFSCSCSRMLTQEIDINNCRGCWVNIVHPTRVAHIPTVAEKLRLKELRVKTDSNTNTGFSSKVPACVKETCYEVDGVIMPLYMPMKCLDRVRAFTVRPDDLFLVTYPKSGTTWMEHITVLIQTQGDTTKLEGKHIFSIVPFLEILAEQSNVKDSPMVIDTAETMPSPRMLKTHCLVSWLPADIRTDDPKVKVIYVARNPKDAAVSYYHFCHYVPELPSYESWDVFFEEFLAGRAPQGSWFENVLPWWNRRDHQNVLFVKYEDMKKNLHGTVRRVADFMGILLPDDVIDAITKASTFGAMRENKSANPDFIAKGCMQEGSRSFMRKGVVGDWRNYFTEDQNKRFDELYKKEVDGTGLHFEFGF